MATSLHPDEEKLGSILLRDSYPVSIGHVVPQPGRGASGLGRSHGRRGKRQTRVGFIHQRLSSSKHHGLLPDARFVSLGKICQAHQPKCALCHRLQEPTRSDGHAESGLASVSRPMERGDGRVSALHAATLWLFNAGSLPRLGRSFSIVDAFTSTRGSPSGV